MKNDIIGESEYDWLVREEESDVKNQNLVMGGGNNHFECFKFWISLCSLILKFDKG